MSWVCDQCGKTAPNQPLKGSEVWCSNSAFHTPKKFRKMKPKGKGKR